jgi:hypothetical protein
MQPHDHAPKTLERHALRSLLAIAAAWLAGASGFAAVAKPVIDPVGLTVVGQTEWLAGAPASLRVVLTDHSQADPVGNGRVSIRLSPAGQDQYQTLFRGLTNPVGTLDATFDVPDLAPGDYDLQVSGRLAAGEDQTVQRVRLARRYQILLTTDKPIYQPTQTIHLRALALRRPNLKAVSDAEAVLEVRDAKGNKVFKRALETNDYGIVAADFVLADEVNMGRYEIRCLMGDQQAEKTVTVERYVLPKFDLKLTTEKQYYLPQETVRGTVQADYFYGVPVREAEVEVVVKTFDVEFTEIATLSGQTDDNGTYRFEARLPAAFVGLPLEQGAALLEFDVKVTSKANHAETCTETRTVAQDPVRIEVVPESGKLVPGVENLLYVSTTYPDGSPAPCTVRMSGLKDGGQALPITQGARQADELGLTEFALTPESTDVTVGFDARTQAGETASRSITLESEAAQGGVLLRLDRRLAKVGNRLQATVLTAGQGAGAVYVDVVKDRQTMLTRAAELENGRATVDIGLTPDLTGSIWVSAYRMLARGDILRDAAPVFVDPASDLSIEVTPGKPSYLPGEDAAVQFAVRDAEGRPVAAALGVNVVDESVFALQELKPGMEKVYFYLEQELMKPRVEIHEFDMPFIIAEAPGPKPLVTRREKAAKVLLAGAEMPEASALQVDTYTARVNELKGEWATALQPKLQKLQEALNRYTRRHGGETYKQKLGVKPLLDAGLLKAADVTDQWDQPLLFPVQGDGEMDAWMLVVQAVGPDGKPDTADDLFLSTGWQGWADDKDMLFWDGPGMPGMGGGGFFGGARGAVADMAVPMVAMAREAETGPPPTPTAGAAAEPVRVRKYFPETMLSEPALITDESGRAKLTFPMADSITSWRLTAMANSAAGQLGSVTGSLRCFQDFFVDLDLPVALTQNDQVSVPVMVFNHLDQPQSVSLELTKADWFALDGEPKRTLEIGAKDEAAIYFTLTARQIGSFPLTVHAYGSKLSDAIERRIEVRPDGEEQLETVNGRLESDVTQTVRIPREAIDGASDVMVKIYSGIFSQAVEGLDSVLQMPFGCFEQTSSATYPNILVLDYMKTTGQVTPEIRMKAEGFINYGYQRLVAYEVQGGGFSWFGDPPANQILTAYGLMEFADMSKVYEVDADVIGRTVEWLLSRQQSDGSWKPDEAYLHQESWGRIQNSSLLPTAYVSWALGRAGSQDERLKSAVTYVRKHAAEAKDPYTLALVCNSLVANAPDDPATEAQIDRLLDLAKRKDGQLWWESDITGITHSSGQSADLEATGLAVWGLIHSGTHPGEATEVLNYLIANKDPQGTWYSTQATVLALGALLDAQKGSTQKVDAEITVLCNGEAVKGLAIDPRNADVVHFVSLKSHVHEGDNEVKIKFAGQGSSLYQMTTRHFLPWERKAEGREAVAIGVKYDKTELAVEDLVTANVTIRNDTPGRMGMVLVDLGIPPGFEVQADDLAELVGSKIIQKYTLTGRQIILYLEELAPGREVKLNYRLKAKFPIKAKTPESTAYEYYNPDHQGTAEPVELVVRSPGD